MGGALGVVLALAACSSGGDSDPPAAAAEDGRVTTTAADRASAAAPIETVAGDGFRVAAPGDWRVEPDDSTGRVHIEGAGGERMVLAPLFVATDLTAASAGVLLQTMAGELLPASWGEPTAIGERAVRMIGTSGSRTAVATLAWATSEHGSAGFAAAATADDWEGAAPALAEVLQSFQVVGPADEGGATATTSYQTWRDPTEGAFTVEIPTGWSAAGGMLRPCPVILQGAVEVRSPDGIYLKYGSDYPYFVNDEAGAQFGLGVGDTWPQPCGYASPVAPYSPGAQFVLDYLAPNVPGVEILAVRDRPDLAGQLDAGGLVSYDAGEVEYRYPDRGGTVRGQVLAVTEQTTIGAVGTWDVWRIVIAEGPEARYEEALAAGTHLAESFTFDPTWARAQQQLTADQSRIMAETADAISRTMSEGYWGRQAALDRIFERQSMATLGVEDYQDPVTGDTYRLDTGPTHYWVDPSGTIVGTETSAAPTVDFRELLLLDA